MVQTNMTYTVVYIYSNTNITLSTYCTSQSILSECNNLAHFALRLAATFQLCFSLTGGGEKAELRKVSFLLQIADPVLFRIIFKQRSPESVPLGMMLLQHLSDKEAEPCYQIKKY